MIKRSRLMSVVRVIGLSVALVAAVFGSYVWALRDAQTLFVQGYYALLRDRLETTRCLLARTEAGCSLLVEAYFRMNDSEKLGWASEACLVRGKGGLGVWLARAAALDSSGRSEEAVSWLGQLQQQAPQAVDPYFRQAQILERLKKEDDAAKAYTAAVERVQGQTLVLWGALKFFSVHNRWSEALPAAERLRQAPGAEPALKLTLAEVFQKAGKKDIAQALVFEVKEKLKGQPELISGLKKQFPGLAF